LTEVDHFDLCCPVLYADCSIGSNKVIEAWEGTKQNSPKAITLDNGPEFARNVLDAWAYRRGIRLDFIRPASQLRMALLRALTASLGMNY